MGGAARFFLTWLVQTRVAVEKGTQSSNFNKFQRLRQTNIRQLTNELAPLKFPKKSFSTATPDYNNYLGSSVIRP